MNVKWSTLILTLKCGIEWENGEILWAFKYLVWLIKESKKGEGVDTKLTPKTKCEVSLKK